MARQFDTLTSQHIEFIEAQKMFFVATSAPETKINLSPKGLESFHVVDSTKVIWLNVTGSGNETAAHVLVNPQMTLMFCAFEGKPMILRIYGAAKCIQRGDEQWDQYIDLFQHKAGARQIFEVSLEMVQTSCGFGVPLYAFQGPRGMMDKWAKDKGEEGIKEYWKEKNMISIDGKPTGMKV